MRMRCIANSCGFGTFPEDQKRPADAQVTDWVRFVELAIDSQGAQSVDALLHAAVACHALAGPLEEHTLSSDAFL
jgi:hypothetical protein